MLSCVTLNCQVMVRSWSGHGQVMVRSWSGHGQVMVRSLSGHGQVMVRSWSGHGQVMAGHVSSSLRLNVSKVIGLLGRSLYLKSKSTLSEWVSDKVT